MKNYNYPSKCEVVCHSGFDLHFTNGDGIEHLIMCLVVICTPLEKCLFKSFAHLRRCKWAFLLLSCKGYLYIFYILDPYQIYYLEILYMCVHMYVSPMCSIICLTLALVAWVFAVDFCSYSEQGLLSAAGHRLLCAVASPGAEHGLSSVGLVAVVVFIALWQLDSSQTRDWTVFPALTGGFLATVPPGKSLFEIFPHIVWAIF